MSEQTAPAGYYDDGSGRQRWWDGTTWTDNYAPTDSAASGSDPLLEFTSHISGANAKVWIWNDRIEWASARGVSAGKIAAGVLTGGMSLAVTGVGRGGYTTGARKGTEMIPIKAITSVNVKRDGVMNSVLSVLTAAGSIDMRLRHADATEAKRIITELMLAPAQTQTVIQQAPASAPAQPDRADPAEQLKKLRELHDAGILTDDEYETKRVQLIAQL